MTRPLSPRAVVEEQGSAARRADLSRTFLKLAPGQGLNELKNYLSGQVPSRPVATGEFMTPIQLDPQRLLGFRLEARDTVSFDGNGTRIAAKQGVKTGIKPGAKIGQKTGAKVGAKIGLKPNPSL